MGLHRQSRPHPFLKGPFISGGNSGNCKPPNRNQSSRDIFDIPLVFNPKKIQEFSSPDQTGSAFASHVNLLRTWGQRANTKIHIQVSAYPEVVHRGEFPCPSWWFFGTLPPYWCWRFETWSPVTALQTLDLQELDLETPPKISKIGKIPWFWHSETNFTDLVWPD